MVARKSIAKKVAPSATELRELATLLAPALTQAVKQASQGAVETVTPPAVETPTGAPITPPVSEQLAAAGVEGVGRNDAKVQENPALRTVHVIADDGDEKDRYKLLKDQIVLSAEDKKIARGTASEYIEQEFGKGGRSELLAAVQRKEMDMSKTAYMFAIRAAGRSTPDGQLDELGDPIMGETALVWFDKLTDEAESHARRQLRDKDKKAELAPVRDVFGGHWVTLKSEMRRSLKKGYDPRRFDSAGAFKQASKPARKKAGAQTADTKIKEREAARAPVDTAITAMHPAIQGELMRLIEVVHKAREIDALEVAKILNHARHTIETLAAAASAPASPRLPELDKEAA